MYLGIRPDSRRLFLEGRGDSGCLRNGKITFSRGNEFKGKIGDDCSIWNLLESLLPKRSRIFFFFFLSILFLRKRIDGTKLVCENSNVAIIPIISRNKYQERLSNDFIAKKRIESNIHFVPSFNTPFNDCGKPNGFPRFIAGNFNIPPWNTCNFDPLLRANPRDANSSDASGFRSGFFSFPFFFLSRRIWTHLANIQNWSPRRINIQSLESLPQSRLP